MPYIVVESDFSCAHLCYILADEDTFTFLDATVIKATTSKTLSGHHKYAVQDSAFSLLNTLEDAGWRVISMTKVDSPSSDTSGSSIRDFAWTLVKDNGKRSYEEARLGPEPLSPMFGLNRKF
ncbi:hypothetical protein PRIPAC_78747 [Pristionchus pacificus]|uniref:GTP cyclohydrolase 1 feedback regulatory protein n=1 Tax=Pristionchus pacificus TaxID=54126 RepID=A0A2A6BVY6_PRIPA|nr:hypothetical protein PRIPAC_78747 [Pristionchus pacificus]|eukprot:PDM70064.1 hypothetical protein PRIPAC_49276 [Pristionchus pacificus]